MKNRIPGGEVDFENAVDACRIAAAEAIERVFVLLATSGDGTKTHFIVRDSIREAIEEFARDHFGVVSIEEVHRESPPQWN